MKLKHISRNEKDSSTVVCAGRFGFVSRRRVITNTAGIIAVKPVCPADPGD